MEVVKLTYNWAQLFVLFVDQKILILEWGRGTGKSTIIAKRIIDCVHQMPRSNGLMVAETYAQIKTRTLPSTIAGLEQHGYYKDIHYVIGRKPPEEWNWPEPYEPPLDYRHVMIWYTGSCMVFLSQDGSAASGRGMNVDWFVGDEAALLNEKLFETDVLLCMRGGMTRIAHYPDGTWKYFGDCSLHHSGMLATSTPVTANGQWILKFEELAMLQPDKYAFLSASAEINKHNLGEEYFEKARAILPDFLYEAEVENKRISKITDGFYPLLNEDKHCYNLYDQQYYLDLKLNSKPSCLGDKDLNIDAPLIVGIDFGANINCMVICQDHGNEFRVLNNLYVKSPRIIDDLVKDEFVPYYQYHHNKTIHLWYDPSGNSSVANSRLTYAQDIKKQLEQHGWQVQMMTAPHGYNTQHDLKYKLWNDILKENEGTPYPVIRFNRMNTKELWISMTNAPAVQGRNTAIQKNKNSERNKKLDQAHATHFSDAIDLVVVGMFMHYQFNRNAVIAPMMR